MCWPLTASDPNILCGCGWFWSLPISFAAWLDYNYICSTTCRFSISLQFPGTSMIGNNEGRWFAISIPDLHKTIWLASSFHHTVVDLLHFKQGADVGIDIIITLSIVDFGIDQVGETWCSINDNLLAARPHCTTPIELWHQTPLDDK